MNAKPSSHPKQTSNPGITVPRDRVTDDKMPRERTPAPDSKNPRDEDYADGNKPLVAGSHEAKALHDRPPPTKGELGVGTAGDAARPTKSGIHDKPVPPRQSLPRG